MKFPIFILSSCAALLSATSAHACSATSPTDLFIIQNDKNQDGAINLQEWRHAKLAAELHSTQKIGRGRVFRKADRNSDGLLTHEELLFVSYKQHPCTEWSKHFREE